MLYPRALKFVLANLAWIICCVGCQSDAPSAASAIERSDAHYGFLFGQKYRTKTDLYVFGFTQSPEPIYYVGTRADGLTLGPRNLPSQVTTANVGKVFQALPEDGANDIIIMGVAPAGSILTIRAETHEVTTLSTVRGSGGYAMGFIGELVHDGKTNSVLSEFVQSHKQVTGKVPNQDISTVVADKIQ